MYFIKLRFSNVIIVHSLLNKFKNVSKLLILIYNNLGLAIPYKGEGL